MSSATISTAVAPRLRSPSDQSRPSGSTTSSSQQVADEGDRGVAAAPDELGDADDGLHHQADLEEGEEGDEQPVGAAVEGDVARR